MNSGTNAWLLRSLQGKEPLWSGRPHNLPLVSSLNPSLLIPLPQAGPSNRQMRRGGPVEMKRDKNGRYL